MFQHLFEWIYEGSIPAEYIYNFGTAEYIYTSTGLVEKTSYITSQASGLTSVFSFGGTTLLIVVGVAIETFRELEAQLTMRNYKGFLN